MTRHQESELRYGVDRLLVRGKRLFGWGWAAHPARAIESMSLCLGDALSEQRLPVTYGLGRDDVKKAHPTLLNAGASGFVMTGYIADVPARTFTLELRYADGGSESIDISEVLEADARGRRRLREIAWLAAAVLRRLRQGDFAGIVRRARAQDYGAPSLNPLEMVRALAARSDPERRISLLFDHNMGGGANLYRNTLIDERLAAGRTVMLCTYNLPTLDYRLHVRQPGNAEVIYRIDSFLVLERLLRETPIDEVFVNSPVSFDEPLVFVEWIAAQRAQRPAMRLTVAMHDYFPVCPSFVLLDADGRYCGIPDVSICAGCLVRHRASYVMLSPPTKIGPWRALWRRCLDAADEVRCFSESTRTLLLRAYPDLDRSRITVIPHDVEFAPSRTPRLDHRARLSIGIVGHISAQKGAAIVRALVERLDREHDDARVVVIGTLDAAPASPRLTVTGPYARQDLGKLVEAHAVNLVLVPSICPETFSYATEEMMRLAMPIVAFDLGAPAERLRRYALGRVCREVSADAALALIRAYHAELAAKPLAVSSVQ